MLKRIEENSWITSDGMIWLQLLNDHSIIRMFMKNEFEFFIVNIVDETERLIENVEQLIEHSNSNNTDEIICIPVGKMELTADLLYYKLKEK